MRKFRISVECCLLPRGEMSMPKITSAILPRGCLILRSILGSRRKAHGSRRDRSSKPAPARISSASRSPYLLCCVLGVPTFPFLEATPRSARTKRAGAGGRGAKIKMTTQAGLTGISFVSTSGGRTYQLTYSTRIKCFCICSCHELAMT
jgi:hypothetical protein